VPGHCISHFGGDCPRGPARELIALWVPPGELIAPGVPPEEPKIYLEGDIIGLALTSLFIFSFLRRN